MEQEKYVFSLMYEVAGISKPSLAEDKQKIPPARESINKSSSVHFLFLLNLIKIRVN